MIAAHLRGRTLGMPETLLCGGVSLALYIVLALLGDLREHLEYYLLLHALLFLIYGVLALRIVRADAALHLPDDASRPRFPGTEAVPDRSPFRSRWRCTMSMLAFAVVFRAALIATPATLSDDVHRYVWDGRVQAAGFDPYAEPPVSDQLASLRDEGWEKVNHPSIRTIYPPLAQAVFYVAAEAGLRERGFKGLFALLDLGVCVALAWVLWLHRREPTLAALYAWNPLVVVEVASSGHLDPMALLPLVVSVGLFARGRRIWGLIAWAAAGAARFLPLAFAPLMIRRHRSWELAVPVAVLALVWVPYAGAGWNLLSGLWTYAENWDHNTVVFPALRAALASAAPFETLERWAGAIGPLVGAGGTELLERLLWPATLARAILFCVFLAGSLVISLEVRELHREIYLAAGLLLILTPTLHPWYLIWIVPFAVLQRSPVWLIFTALAPISYVSMRTSDGRVPWWALLLEWGVPALLAVVLAARRRALRRVGGSANGVLRSAHGWEGLDDRRTPHRTRPQSIPQDRSPGEP